MNPALRYIDAELCALKRDGLYRVMTPGRVDGPHITIRGKKMLNMCSNDYLGIRPSRSGTSQMQSSSRLVSGNDTSHGALEEAIAAHRCQQDALIFPTGYMANLGIITAMVQKGDTILSDQLNHSSIIDACKLAGAHMRIYRHNDCADLRKKIHNARGRIFVVTEGVFSMDGDLARLDEIAEIARGAGAITILDDAHGDFVTGGGRGTAAHFGVAKKIDVHVSSLSKGLGSFGGYVAAQKNVIQYCTNKSRQFIYTSALPSALVTHALGRMKAGKSRYRKRLERNVKNMVSGLVDLGYETGSQSHIIPIIVGNEGDAMRLGRYMMKNGIFAQPIRYPTVARGAARIRMSVTAWLDDLHVEHVLEVLGRARGRFGMLQRRRPDG